MVCTLQIKSTFPHRYVVKPHRGEIAPSSNMEIDVTLLPFHFRETEKYNDKFLLQVDVNYFYSYKNSSVLLYRTSRTFKTFSFILNLLIGLRIDKNKQRILETWFLVDGTKGRIIRTKIKMCIQIQSTRNKCWER